ncbi:MAG: hypothetical protein VX527_12850 [Planctomycetota bacterium]|nr:hypothetical protein [Planctomycetota bacterium]
MFGVHALFATTGLILSLLSASCEVGVSATPVSLQVQAKGRYTPSDMQNRPCDMVIPQPDGTTLVYRDIDCDGVADYVLVGNRWIPLHGGGHGPYRPGYLQPLPRELPYYDPGYQYRSADDFIQKTGLHDMTDGDEFTQTLWMHRLSTSAWTMDVTVPSTSRCHHPDFMKYDLEFEWTIVPADTGPDFEAWRVAGDINEVLRFLIECGLTALSMDTASGNLDVRWDEDVNAIHVMINGSNEYWISLD